MKKQLLALLIAALMIFTVIPVSAEGEIWDGSVADSFASGSGTEDDPYIITNGSELAYLSKIDTTGLYFELARDIILNNAKENKWIDISFYGNLDGKGFSIIGLYISTLESYAGLFKYTENAIIKNLTLKDAYIEGADYVGGFIGEGYKTSVENCHFKGTIKGNAEGADYGEYCGGIAGYLSSSHTSICHIKNCTSEGTIEGKDRVGGIVGYIIRYINIIDCTNYSTVFLNGYGNCVGGIAGSTDGGWTQTTAPFQTIKIPAQVTNCKNYGTIGGSDYPADTGGIIGISNWTHIKDCINYGNITGMDCGGIAGDISSSYDYHVIENCTNYGDISSEDGYCGGIFGDSWDHYQFNNEGTENLVSNCKNFGKIIAKGEYSDANCGGIGGVSNEIKIESCYNYGDVCGFSMAGGIIAEFSAPFYETSIKNCYNSGNISGYQLIGGIAGYINTLSEGTFKILGVTNTGKVSGRSTVGGLVGALSGNSIVDIEECQNKGDVEGYEYVGGLMGEQNSDNEPIHRIANCLNDATVKLISEEGANGGGLVGHTNGALLINCINAGKMEFGENANVGGIAGLFRNITISDCCYFKNDKYTGAPEGELEYSHAFTQKEMKDEANFINFDFLNVWIMGEEHPELREATLTLLGDVNFDNLINSRDYVIVKRYCMGNGSLDGDAFMAADVNCDRIVDKKDYALIKRYCFNSGIIK